MFCFHRPRIGINNNPHLHMSQNAFGADQGGRFEAMYTHTDWDWIWLRWLSKSYIYNHQAGKLMCCVKRQSPFSRCAEPPIKKFQDVDLLMLMAVLSEQDIAIPDRINNAMARAAPSTSQMLPMPQPGHHLCVLLAAQSGWKRNLTTALWLTWPLLSS